MLFKALLVSFGIVSAAQAVSLPVVKRGGSQPDEHANIADTDILNYALMLEHLENAFYTGGLQNFSQQDFLDAGFGAPARGFYEQVLDHETTHVDNLTTILGDKAVKACTYNFGVTNVSTFVALSDMLEAIGGSAYSGAAHYIKNQSYLTMAATILATESRQSTWINNAVRGGNPWSTAYETPLDLNQVFTLASSVIVSCPANNTPIPVVANPALTATPPTAGPGQNITLQYTPASGQPGKGLFAAFLSGNTPTFVPLPDGQNTFSVTIPSQSRGFFFIAITNSSSKADDSTTVAGPAFFNFAFDSNNTVITLPH